MSQQAGNQGVLQEVHAFTLHLEYQADVNLLRLTEVISRHVLCKCTLMVDRSPIHKP